MTIPERATTKRVARKSLAMAIYVTKGNSTQLVCSHSDGLDESVKGPERSHVVYSQVDEGGEREREVAGWALKRDGHGYVIPL